MTNGVANHFLSLSFPPSFPTIVSHWFSLSFFHGEKKINRLLKKLALHSFDNRMRDVNQAAREQFRLKGNHFRRTIWPTPEILIFTGEFFIFFTASPPSVYYLRPRQRQHFKCDHLSNFLCTASPSEYTYTFLFSHADLKVISADCGARTNPSHPDTLWSTPTRDNSINPPPVPQADVSNVSRCLRPARFPDLRLYDFFLSIMINKEYKESVGFGCLSINGKIICRLFSN